MNVSVVIVNWNSQEYLRKCLSSILEHTRKVTLEIVVIDSGSFDGCEPMLREHFPQVRFIQSPANLGFARANNQAVEATRGEAVLFLNPDTELVGPSIDELSHALASLPDAGVLGCRLLNSDGSLQSSCVQSIPTIVNQLLGLDALRRFWPKGRLWGAAALYGGKPGPHVVEALSGACIMVRRQVFFEVGRFSEDYFMYAEDVDLAYKVRQAGYKAYYLPGVSVVHHGGGSSGQAVSAFAAVMMREAIWRFLRKTRGLPYAMGYRAAMLLAACSRLTLLGLARLARPSGTSHRATLSKWQAVLRWGVNRDGVVARYYPTSG